MKLYQAFDLDKKTPVQWLAVHPLRWRPEWGEPAVMFREVDDEHQALFDAASEMHSALARAEQTFRNLLLGGFVEPEDSETTEIWMNELENMRTLLKTLKGEGER